jgi:hypothetical protein
MDDGNYGRKLLASERELLATDKSLRSGGVDHRDNEQHLAAVRDKGSAALHEAHRVPYPSLVSAPRAILDRVNR